MQKSILLSVVSFFAFSVLALSISIAVAQDPTPTVNDAPAAENQSLADERLTIETKAKEEPAYEGLKLEREIRPRLPNGFRYLVDRSQQEKIYDIQREYNEIIALLELRIELLKKERDTKIDAVLTPSQLQRLNRPTRRSQGR